MPIVAPGRLAGALKATRRRFALSLREAAQLAGVSAATYSRVERHQKPDVDTFLRLSSFVLVLQRRRRARLSMARKDGAG
jgi:transcriptional regulator with XRE-family HTH domain